MNDIIRTIDTHLAGYCEPDPARRLELLASAWAPEGTLVDPPIDGAGVDGISAMVDAVLSHYPGHRFVRTTTIDAHHQSARYGWALLDGDGTVVLDGVDLVDFDGDGKLVRVVGFFGQLAPAAVSA